MPYVRTLPPTSIHGTWVESLELYSVDDEELADLSAVTEIILSLRDPCTGYDDLQLSMSGGDITVPSPGIIQWRAEITHMSGLATKLYEAIMQIEVDEDVVVLVLGSISIVE